ncbi:class I SAM-dependent methyltransferase [Methylicorpusculum sp.]|uniref:class I SAM-dependent methyltransferase n=1 Tax=Methylicorpusculum sp. TaxID=2713644 RepID=UPI002730A84B|nr:class I SAM-dependent methyltransferase [Methylicorpusculum sp.]MDP2178490.1 class I SAM-dependent methyltransferase [Methylicorpusculum sp.]MDP3530319.1 class I SAM-dependent methyltransferase [Methylicorpusculum sp.]MDZ4154238.1 class I SAM-dependent methyltransferase [Methylicorpusculum sp.]
MTELNEVKAKVAATYDAASDLFDHPANTFWDRFGRDTINRLDLKPGNLVLDVCCGSGASALPAAEQVGDTGHVIGIDLAEKLLNLASAKAKIKSLNNVEFRRGDMLNTGFDDASFDAVVCVFGIFFVPDISVAIRELWRVLRPGGKLAITTWGSDFFEPANTVFWNSVRDVRPDLYKGFNPWDRISEPSTLSAILNEGGVPDPWVIAEPGTHPVASPEDWWTTLLGSGYRGIIDQMEPEMVEYVRQENFASFANARIKEVQANVVYAVAEKT